MDRIGTVEILRQRIYQLDAETHDTLCTTVIVEPGTFDLYSDGMTKFWMLRGRINRRSERLGDGLFAMHSGDVPSDVEVVFPSKRFGPDEWAEFARRAELDRRPFRAAPARHVDDSGRGE